MTFSFRFYQIKKLYYVGLKTGLSIFFMLALPALSLFSQADSSLGYVADSVLLSETQVIAYKADALHPLSFKNLPLKDIDALNLGQEPSQLLSHTPSVTAFSDAGNFQGYSYFRIRGMDQTRVNMSLDGVPLNEPEDQGAYFSNYPDLFNSLQSVQIQRGVGTSANGVASYAGSMLLQSPHVPEEQTLQFGADYGSYNTSRVYGEYTSRPSETTSVYARLSKLSSQGFKYHSSNDAGSALICATARTGANQFKFTALTGYQKNQLAWLGVPLETIRQDARTNANSDEKDQFSQSIFSLSHSLAASSKLSVNTTGYYNFLNGGYDFDLNNFLKLPPAGEMFHYAFRHHFAGMFSNFNYQSNGFRLNGGVHANTFMREHIGSELGDGVLYENTGIKNEFSSFVKLRYTLGKLIAFADAQYRYSDFAYKGDLRFETMHWHFLNPKAGFTYAIDSSCSVYYSFGTCGREPTRNDLFMGEDNLKADASGRAILQKVPPEFVYDHELGFNFHSHRLKLNANLYYMSFSDEIVLNGQYGPNGLALHSNVANSFRSGFECDAHYRFHNGLFLQNSSSIQYNRIDENSISFEPILSPVAVLNQSVGFEKGRFYGCLFARYQSRSFIDFANEFEAPAYWQLDCMGEYRMKKLRFRLYLQNLTSNEIISNGYLGVYGEPLYFVQAPFHFNAGVQWDL